MNSAIAAPRSCTTAAKNPIRRREKCYQLGLEQVGAVDARDELQHGAVDHAGCGRAAGALHSAEDRESNGSKLAAPEHDDDKQRAEEGRRHSQYSE